MAKQELWAYYRNDPFGSRYQYEGHYVLSADSPRIKGKLRLQPNAYTFQHDVVTMANRPSAAASPILGLGFRPDWNPTTVEQSLRQQATVRFNRRLQEGKASLGITIAQWQSSRDMIVDRSRKLASIFDGRYQRARRLGKRYSSKATADDILEGQFGWLPLLADLHAASTSAFTAAIPPLHVSGRAKRRLKYVKTSGSGANRVTATFTGTQRCTVDAFVRIGNPNLWLANRMGFVNPAQVAWDAIPWSWVVGMFVNANAMMTQFTDELGLIVEKRSVTSSVDFLRELRLPGGSLENDLFRRKTRTTGEIPAVHIAFRMPELNWQTAITASALLVQRVKKLQSLQVLP